MSDTKISEAAPAAWLHEEDSDRVVSAAQKATAIRDGGASASSVKPYTVAAYTHPQPAELAFDVEEMLTACVPGGSIVDPQVVADNIRAWLADRKPTELAEQQGVEWNDSARLAYLESFARQPGGLLLHAESNTGRRGLGLGENCGNRTLAQAIDGCATHAEKDRFSALGKQQVGEVQGDARRQWLEIRGLAAGIVKNLKAFAESPHKASWCGALDDSLSFAEQIEKDADAAYIVALAAHQPVGEPVDYHPPSLVDAAGMMAIESFLAVAEEFRRSAEPYIEPINEGGSAGDDEISEVFDSHLNHAKGAVSRSTIYAVSSALDKEGGQ